MTFDPNQPRDREGKWTETGGGGRRGGSSNPMNSLGRWKQKGIPPGQGPGPLKISGAKTLNQAEQEYKTVHAIKSVLRSRK